MPPSAELRLPLPEWAASWPVGLLPRELWASDAGVVLRYVAADGTTIDVTVTPLPGSLSLRASDDTPLARRLTQSVARQVAKTRDEARRWVIAAIALARGSAASDPLHAIVIAFDRALPLEQISSKLREARALGAAPGLDPATVIVSFAAGRFEDALGAWASDTTKSLGSPLELLAAALRDRSSGRGAQAREHILALSRHVVDREHRVIVARALVDVGELAEAASHWSEIARHGAEERDLRELGRVAVLARDYETALVAARRLAAGDVPGGPTGARALEAARIMEHAGAFAEAVETLESIPSNDPARAAATTRLAVLALWRLDLETARAHALRALDSGAQNADVETVLGALCVLEGHPVDGCVHLDRAVLLDPTDVAPRLWRVRAYLDSGQLDRAKDELQIGDFADHPMRHLLLAVLDERIDPDERWERREARFHPAVLVDVLGAEVRPHLADPEETRRLVDRAIVCFGGNYSRRPTLLDTERRVSRTTGLSVARDRAVAMQRALVTDPPSQVLASFAGAARESPETPFFETYAAEISLWLGDYDRALFLFDELWRRTRTRWSYVGSGAALVMLGRLEEGLARFREGDESTYISQEATYTYRGRARRLLGDLDLAERDLTQAVATSPLRLGAWVELGLLQTQSSRHDAARSSLEKAAALAPSLVHEASIAAAQRNWRSTQDPVTPILTTAVTMLRGNRSSSLYTYFTDTSELRVVDAQTQDACASLAKAASVLARDTLLTTLLSASPSPWAQRS